MSRKPAELQNHPVGFEQAKAVGLYRAACQHVVDGDTADFLVDLGLYHYAYVALRVIGVDTPELVGVPAAVREAGLAAKARTEALLLHGPALLDTHREKRSFERFIGRVWIPRPADLAIPPDTLRTLTVDHTLFVDLADVLIAEGHGQPMAG
jgi:endonuclease YncB( thermonuclease family)